MPATHTRRTILAAGAFGVMVVSASRAGSRGWRYPDGVEISTADIVWFRACRSRWIDSESGAPAILSPDMVPDDLLKMTGAEYAAYERRIEPILCAFFLHAAFAPGRYEFRSPLDGHSDVEVTDDDIKLLQATNWRTFGIDSKRPYGNFSYYEADMAQVLGLPVPLDAKGKSDLDHTTETRMAGLHRKMRFVLQAYLENARLEPGRWFIPLDGWDMYPHPPCRPAGAQAILAYKRAMAAIAVRGLFESQVDLVVPRLQASANLFAVD